MIGQGIAHYRILSKLGEGGMGAVYRAEDSKLGRQVALKVLPEEFASDPERLERFEREARTLAVLNHPNIVTIYSVEVASEPVPDGVGEVHFLTMELVEGKTLDEHIVSGPIPLPTLLDLVTPIVEALAAAHEKSIVHRDLKPGNVMVTKDGRVKVLDFGLAKQVVPGQVSGDAETMVADLTTTGTLVGTPAYMSPEQVRGEAADSRSDLFALGLIVHELACGKHPFRRKSPMETASAILQEPVPDLTESLADSPPLLAHLLAKLLAKDPNDRYQTARGLVSDLKALAGDTSETKPGRPAPTDDRFSIAVLPFTNMSADPENDFLADGLAEDLINELARVEGVKVVARTSAFQFRGRDLDVREIGDKLGVGTVLEGSVRAAGSRLRVSAQVVNVEDGYQVWSERFDRERADIFDIQDEITAAISERIRRAVGDKAGVADSFAKPAGQRNAEAHAAFLKGRHRMLTLDPAGYESARRYFEQALAVDPEYADAYAALSWLAINVTHFGGKDPKPLYEEARAFAERALEISDLVADAHAGLGFVYMYADWDWAASEEAYRRGVELAPSSAATHMWFACLLSVVGRHDEAVAEAYQAQALDPLAGIVNGVVGLSLNGAGRYEEAVQQLTRGIEADPAYFLGHLHRATSHIALGNYDQAAEDAKNGFELVADPMALVLLIPALERGGRVTEAAEWLTRFEGMSDSPFVRPFHWATVQLARGELDEGFAWLEKSLDARDGLVPWVPGWAVLRGTAALADPRFEAARERLNLPRPPVT